ncbi:hypothetical protein BCR44DRAFT_1540976 [Catenaria anguillulae PL171]|uniref:PH domain-containing protein n=1 Tax=Catenaria anguillulae PL171 TaxID=765915 RepID=A0A1Y2I0J8_9FUNG|nr:hypothetical protein BCR44DRAFT_1540976 [Catenaria anguillulae PL171]
MAPSRRPLASGPLSIQEPSRSRFRLGGPKWRLYYAILERGNPYLSLFPSNDTSDPRRCVARINFNDEASARVMDSVDSVGGSFSSGSGSSGRRGSQQSTIIQLLNVAVTKDPFAPRPESKPAKVLDLDAHSPEALKVWVTAIKSMLTWLKHGTEPTFDGDSSSFNNHHPDEPLTSTVKKDEEVDVHDVLGPTTIMTSGPSSTSNGNLLSPFASAAEDKRIHWWSRVPRPRHGAPTNPHQAKVSFIGTGASHPTPPSSHSSGRLAIGYHGSGSVDDGLLPSPTASHHSFTTNNSSYSRSRSVGPPVQRAMPSRIEDLMAALPTPKAASTANRALPRPTSIMSTASRAAPSKPTSLRFTNPNRLSTASSADTSASAPAHLARMHHQQQSVPKRRSQVAMQMDSLLDDLDEVLQSLQDEDVPPVPPLPTSFAMDRVSTPASMQSQASYGSQGPPTATAMEPSTHRDRVIRPPQILRTPRVASPLQ